jgi:hypothetical protein
MRVIEPHPRQKYAMQCPADEIFFGGAAGGGKSFLLLFEVARGAADYGKNFRAVIFRKEYPMLEQLQIYLLGMFSGMGSYNQSKHNFIFNNGALLQLRSLEKDRDVEKYQGQEYGFIGFDELPTWPTEYCWTYMASRARSSKGVKTQMIGTGNPGGVGHAWVKNRFIDGFKPDIMYKKPVWQDDAGAWHFISQCFIPSRLEDNPDLLVDDRYMTRLMDQPEYLRRALRYGDWDIIAGQVFDEWRRDRHVLKNFSMPQAGWFRFYAMDWGYSKPYAIGEYGVNGDGKVIKYGERYGCVKGQVNVGVKKSSKEVAVEAWSDARRDGVTDMVADPACWNRQDNFPAPIDAFKEAGFHCIKANNDRIAGLQVFHNYLKEEDENGQPMYQVAGTCYHTIRTLPVLLPNPNKPEDVDTTLEDHIYDSDRYALMSRFVSYPTLNLPECYSSRPVQKKLWYEKGA